MSANADGWADSDVRQPPVSRIMLTLRFALVLLLSAGNGVLADTPADNVASYHPQPGPNTQNGYPLPNLGTVQQWNGSPSMVQQPMPQQPGNVPYMQQVRAGNSYNSEDYDGEQYEDNRLRLILYPKKPITLNETNLRTWKANPVTNSKWSQIGVTEPNEPVLAFRRSGFSEEATRNSEPAEATDSAKNAPNKHHIQLFLGINTSNATYFPGTQPISNTQIFSDSLTNTNSLKNQISGQAAISAPKDELFNGTAEIVASSAEPVNAATENRNISETNIQQEINQINGNESKAADSETFHESTNGKTEIANKHNVKDNATDAAYVDIETESDYDDEQGSDQADDVPDVPDGNSYVLVLPGMKGRHVATAKNISSAQTEIVSDSLLYMLSNLTMSNAINERRGRWILQELREQKAQINEVGIKISNMYELLKKPNQDN